MLQYHAAIDCIIPYTLATCTGLPDSGGGYSSGPSSSCICLTGGAGEYSVVGVA